MWWHTRWNQISSFVRNGRVHLNLPVGVSSVDCWQQRCSASAVVMLDIPCSEVVWRVLATHSIRQFSLHFPSRASPCAITFQLTSTNPWRNTINQVHTNNRTHSPLPTENGLQGRNVSNSGISGLFRLLHRPDWPEIHSDFYPHPSVYLCPRR